MSDHSVCSTTFACDHHIVIESYTLRVGQLILHVIQLLDCCIVPLLINYPLELQLVSVQ